MTDTTLKTAAVRPTGPGDLAEIARLHDAVFGPGAYTRTAYRIREAATRSISPYCLVSRLDGELIASLRFTEVTIGGVGGALLLGPLCVATAHAGHGYGKALVADGLERAKAAGEHIVLLVGDVTYYGRFGFVPVPPGQIVLPGPVDLRRLLAVELVPGTLAEARGMVTARRG